MSFGGEERKVLLENEHDLFPKEPPLMCANVLSMPCYRIASFHKTKCQKATQKTSPLNNSRAMGYTIVV